MRVNTTMESQSKQLITAATGRFRRTLTTPPTTNAVSATVNPTLTSRSLRLKGDVAPVDPYSGAAPTGSVRGRETSAKGQSVPCTSDMTALSKAGKARCLVASHELLAADGPYIATLSYPGDSRFSASAVPTTTTATATVPPTTTGTTTVPATGSMPPPTGYRASQLSLDDQFSGTTLNTNNWFPGYTTGGPIGFGATGTATHQTYFDPNEVVVDNGLSLNLVYDDTYASDGWNTRGGCLTSKFTVTSGYVQVRAKMPDSQAGEWPAIWLVPTDASDPPEIDMMEAGFLPDETGAPNETNPNFNYAPNYHEPSGAQPLQFKPGANWSSTELTQWNTYGMEVDPAAQTVKFYFNGVLMAEQQGAVPDIPWTLILWNAFSAPTQSGYHTVGGTGSGLTGNNAMDVSEVQVYS